MLLYSAPFLEKGPLTIFKDDKDSETFYYLNTQPSIHVGPQGPSIAAYALLPESGQIGDSTALIDAGLSLEVSLQVSEEVMEAVREEIKEQWGKPAKRLVPAPISDGKVYLIIAQAGEEPDPANWFITSGFSPSILGDNRAAIVAKTNGEDAKRMIATLKNEVFAAQVYYELNYLGITPVYKASMQVRWEKIYQHFDELKSKNYIFYKDEVSQAVDSLQETNLIEIEVAELDPDVRDLATKSMFNELKNKVIEKLFQPAVPPLSASENLENRIGQGISRVLSSLVPGHHYIRREIEEGQLVDMTIDMSERRVKKFPFYPQGLLSTMIERVGGIGDRLVWIQLDDLDFKKETIYVNLAADSFQLSNIQAVKIVSRIIDSETQERVAERVSIFESQVELRDIFSFNRQKDKSYHLEYQTTIYLDDQSATLPDKLETPWILTSDFYVYLDPQDHFDNQALRISIDDPEIFQHIQLIEATLSIREKETEEVIHRQTMILTQDNYEPDTIAFLSAKSIPVKMDLDIKYYLSGQNEYELNLKDMQDDHYFIPNPFENKWSVETMCLVDWTQTLKVLTEIRVWDVAREEYIHDKFTFAENQTEYTFYAVTSLETPREELEYRLTVVRKDGTIPRGAWTQHAGPLLLIRDEVKAERTIRAKLQSAPDFAEKEIRKVLIAFKYEDPANNISEESENLEFKAIGDVQTFTHPMPDLSEINYQYRVQVFSRRGNRYKTDWKEAYQENLEVIIPENIW